MNAFTRLPWLEFTLLGPAAGALVAAFIRTPPIAWRWSMAVALATLVAGVGTSLTALVAGEGREPGWGVFRADAVAAPMLPVLGWLHLLTLLGTAKSRLTPAFCTRLLISAAVTGGILTCQRGPLLVGLLAMTTVIPAWDLRERRERMRGYLLHLLPFVALLVAGWSLSSESPTSRGSGLMLLALTIVGGVFPFHGWIPSLFQRASFGTAMVFVLPLAGVAAVLRLLLPVTPGWMLNAAGIACLVTAVYAAGMGVVQRETRRFFAFLALSQSSMVLFAAFLHTPTSVTAALCLWISLIVSLSGLGFAIRALEARFGLLSLREHHGHYQQVPGLAVVFLTAGLASVGFPGTVGFVPMELLISSSVEQGLGYSVTLAVAAMLNGIAILRAYFSLFTGKMPATSVSLRETPKERAGIIVVAALIFLAGWFSPAVVESRHHAAEKLLGGRTEATPPGTAETPRR